MATSQQPNEPIAIIGTGCRFPGGASSPSKLWDLLESPHEVAKEIPKDRFNLDRFYHKDGSHHGTCNVKETYFLEEDVRQFDAAFFGIPPGEAAAMDPQHRLLLETVFEAMEAGNTTISDLRGSNAAAFVGVMCSDYYILHAQDFNHVPTYNSTGIANSNASARLSYFFDWHGPSMTIDTACSSSLVAVHQAVQALRAGTAKVAVAAGTNLLLSPLGYISESKLSMLSPTGRCRMWDECADGYARGEGVAALLLKPLSHAIADGDRVECVIRETGVNQDGKTKGITMPSAVSQAALIRDTYARAGLDLTSPEDRCQYFEAHGTGTPAGDPQEAEAIHTAFFGDREHDEDEKLYVGSVKTVIGHTEGTAGIAGVLKACLAMKNGIMPPNLLFKKLAPALEPFYKNLEVVASPRVWPEPSSGQCRRASVNSFGFGGTNAHAILEECRHLPQEIAAAGHEEARVFLPFTFSAATEKSLHKLLELYAPLIASGDMILDQLAYTLTCRRSHLPYRVSFAAQNHADLSARITATIADERKAQHSLNKAPAVLGIFTGQGAQWPQMGLQLLRSIPLAREFFEEMDHALANLPHEDRPEWTLLAEIEKAGECSRLSESIIAQPLVCAVQLLLVTLMHKAGIAFDAVVGHSSGEIAAAYTAGFLSKQDAMRIAYYRGLHSRLATGPEGRSGAMLAVGTSLEDAQEFCALEDFQGRIGVAASNSNTSITLSGDADAITEAQAILEEEGKFARALRVDKAYHSHHMQVAAAPFLASLQSCNIKVLEPAKASPTWISSVHEGPVSATTTDLGGQYWVDNLNGTVRFSQGLTHAWGACGGFDIALEIGPHAALKGPVLDTIQLLHGKSIPYIPTLTRGQDDVNALAESLGAIWATACPHGMDFNAYLEAVRQATANPGALHDLPTYPWTHDRVLWSESRYTKLLRQQEGRFHDILGTRTPDGTEEEWRWRNVLSPKELPWLTDHGLQGQTVFPATGYISLATEAAQQIAGETPVKLLELTELSIIKAIAIDSSNGTETLVALTRICRDAHEITALFSCFSTISRDAAQLGLNATGKIRVQLGEPVDDLLAPRAEAAHGMVPVDPEHFFNEVDKIGYNYGPTFRGINKLERKLGCSSGTIRGPANDETGTTLLFHPGMLDAALQGMLCGFSSPGDGRLWSLHAPSTIRRVTIVPSLVGANMTPDVHFDCAVTDVAYNRLTGDVEVFQSDSGYKSIGVEGVAFIPFSAATEADDRLLFAKNVWDVDGPHGEVALGNRRATAWEIEKAYDAERVAYYYLRTLREAFPPNERTSMTLPEHHAALLEYADHIYGQVERGEHAYVKAQWNDDDHEIISAIAERYGPRDADFVLTQASGEALPAVVRGETTILEHMTRGDKLDNYYKNALGFVELNRLMSRMVSQIAHRYPHMEICEIGAGTGGATRGIIDNLGTAFSSYTYTDISSGFFPKAQEAFSSTKDRMMFKTLDINELPSTQGFDDHAYDLVLAANVLHATRDLVATLKNVRRLLKPGGYLVMMEFTDTSPMRMGLIIGGLPGWWIGREEGRKHSPAATLPQWNESLHKAGFAGVETSTPVLDPLVMPACIIASQAVDQDYLRLRQPLSTPRDDKATHIELVIIGGTSDTTNSAVYRLKDILAPHYKGVVHSISWEALAVEGLPKSCSILCLSDCDAPFWKNITAERFSRFKTVLLAARSLLWVSHGSDCENPDGAMTYGFFRCLVYELPEASIQFLDVPEPHDLDAVDLAQRLLRLDITSSMRKTGVVDKMLWTTEPEVRVRKQAFIPRLFPEPAQNNRYNSAKREIVKSLDLNNNIITLHCDGGKYYALEEDSPKLEPSAGSRRIQVDASILSALTIHSNTFFFSLGTDLDSGEHALAVATKNASAIRVPAQWSVPVETGRNIDAQYLSFLSGYLMSKQIASVVPMGRRCLMYEADPGLASLLSRQLSEQGSPVTFLTSAKGAKRRNWTYVHPRIADRHLAATIPPDVHIYIDLSADSRVAGTERLGARIATMMNSHCRRYDATLLMATQADACCDEEGSSVQDLLLSANAFAATQLNGVPEGMPLRTIPVDEVASSNDYIHPISIVNWRNAAPIPARVEPVTNRKDLFSCDKTYWLIGLAGDMGRSITDFMVAHGARHVVLTSRNPKVDERWLEDHRSQGAEILYTKGDISQRGDVHAIFNQISASNMPPIAGVANGALVLRDKGLVNMDLDTFHANTLGKVEGTEHIHELFATNTLDWFIAFSSISATVGNMGQMAYAAANSYMKALITQRRRDGLAGSTIDISQVFGVGYIEREMKLQSQLSREQAVRLMNKSGTIVMSEPDLHQLFAEAIINGRPESDASPEIISGIKTVTPSEAEEALWGRNVRFGHFVHRLGTALPSSTKAAAVPVKQLLEAADSEEALTSILHEAFVKKLKASMMTGEDTLLATTPLVDLGVDSLVAVEIRSWFKQDVGVDIAVLKILGGPSAEELVADAAATLAAERALKAGDSAAESTDESMYGKGSGDEGSQTPPTDVEDEVVDHDKACDTVA